jgi:magnesium transporter
MAEDRVKEEVSMKIRLVHNGVFTTTEDIQDALKPPAEGFYWIDADTEDLEVLQQLFGLHDLAVEDCLTEEEQRPKVEIYENQYFLVINSIRFDDEEIFLRALNIFLGRHYIITVTRQKINELRNIKPVLLYHLVDTVVDNYFVVGDRIEARIEGLEEEIMMHTRKSHLTEIIGLRSEILWLKKVLGPQRDVIATLNKKDLRLIDNQLQKYFGDVHENAVKIYETFETYRDLMGNLREAYQLSVANRANEIMRVFTALTTIFMPLTFITGVYGMNFEFIPGMHERYGAVVLLILMVALGLGMYTFFRKKDWL